MITMKTSQHVPGLSARGVYDFLSKFEDQDYQAWWPGVHLKVITYRRSPTVVGSLYYLDQIIGDYRVSATEVITEAVPAKRILRQVVSCGMRMPIRMLFEFEDDDAGVMITHTVTAGFRGLGSVLDPAFRLYFTRRFAAALDQHMKDELLMLPKLIPAAH